MEQFQFETRCVSNHTACHFVEKARFFPLALVRAARCIRGMPLLVTQDFFLIKAFIGQDALKMFPLCGDDVAKAAGRLFAVISAGPVMIFFEKAAS